MNVDHSHVFWLCPKIIHFWEDAHKEIIEILGYNIPNTCVLLYLGNMSGHIVLKEDRYLLKIVLAACKKAITRKWHRTDPPTQQDWKKIVSDIYVMEMLTHKVRTQEEVCHEKWEK